MNNRLPRVFVNKITSIKNNEKVSYGYNDVREAKPNKYETFDEKDNISQKVRRIFNSPNYIFKIKVNLKTKEGTFIKTLIGKNSTSLITIDNEKIPLIDVLDISICD